MDPHISRSVDGSLGQLRPGPGRALLPHSNQRLLVFSSVTFRTRSVWGWVWGMGLGVSVNLVLIPSHCQQKKTKTNTHSHRKYGILFVCIPFHHTDAYSYSVSLRSSCFCARFPSAIRTRFFVCLFFGGGRKFLSRCYWLCQCRRRIKHLNIGCSRSVSEIVPSQSGDFDTVGTFRTATKNDQNTAKVKKNAF